MHMRLLAALAGVGLIAGPAAAATVRANPSTVADVLGNARPGDVVKLDAGAYAPFRFGARTFNPPLVIDASAATITGNVYWRGLDGVTLRGGTWTGGLRFDGSNRIRLEGITAVGPPTPGGYGLFFMRGGNVTVTGSTFSGFRAGVVLSTADGFLVEKSTFRRMRSDGIDVADSRNGRIVENVISGTRIVTNEHPDCVQFWSTPGKPAITNVVVERNLCVGATQGINQFNGESQGLIIRGNTIVAGYPHGIAMYGAKDLVLQDNQISTYMTDGTRWPARITIGDSSTVATRTGNRVAAAMGRAGASDAPTSDRATGLKAAEARVAALTAKLAAVQAEGAQMKTAAAAATDDDRKGARAETSNLEKALDMAKAEVSRLRKADR